jgi:hypothetical protein
VKMDFASLHQSPSRHPLRHSPISNHSLHFKRDSIRLASRPTCAAEGALQMVPRIHKGKLLKAPLPELVVWSRQHSEPGGGLFP